MKVLVTGGTGFVGTHLVNRLLHRGHAVAVLARDSRKTRNRYNRPVETVRGRRARSLDARTGDGGPRRGRPPGRHHFREGLSDLRPDASRGGGKRRGRGVRGGRLPLSPHERHGQLRGLAVGIRTHQGGGGEGRPRIDALAGRSSGRRSSSGRATGSSRSWRPSSPETRGSFRSSARGRRAFSRSRSRMSPASSPTRSRNPRRRGEASKSAVRRRSASTTSTARSRRPSENRASLSSIFRSGTGGFSRGPSRRSPGAGF